MVNPYNDLGLETDIMLREFKQDVDDSELVWHRDRSDREITVLSGYNWKLQMDDNLPEELKHGRIYHIKKMVNGNSIAIKLQQTQVHIGNKIY